MGKANMFKKFKINKKRAPVKKIVVKKEEKKEKTYPQHNGMNLLEGEPALLLAEVCKLDKQKKAAEKRIKEIKTELNFKVKGEFTNKAGDIAKISVSPKKSDIDPLELYNHCVAQKLPSKFWSCVKVQITPLKKVIPESVIETMQYDLDSIVKCGFK